MEGLHYIGFTLRFKRLVHVDCAYCTSEVYSFLCTVTYSNNFVENVGIGNKHNLLAVLGLYFCRLVAYIAHCECGTRSYLERVGTIDVGGYTALGTLFQYTCADYRLSICINYSTANGYRGLGCNSSLWFGRCIGSSAPE